MPYCYHMYIALLAGGQMIRKMVKKSFDVTDEQGLNTFAFQAKSKMVRATSLDTIPRFAASMPVSLTT